MLAGLLDPEMLRRVSEEENGLKSLAAQDSRFSNTPDSYTQIQKAVSDTGNTMKFMFYEDIHARTSVVDAVRARPLGFDSQLFRIAHALVRATEERRKPNEKRLPEYRDSARPALELALFSEAPIYDDLEVLTLSDSLTSLVSAYGVDDPVVRDLLKGKSPHERAYELVKSTLKLVRENHLGAGPLVGRAEYTKGAAKATPVKAISWMHVNSPAGDNFPHVYLIPLVNEPAAINVAFQWAITSVSAVALKNLVSSPGAGLLGAFSTDHQGAAVVKSRLIANDDIGHIDFEG